MSYSIRSVRGVLAIDSRGNPTVKAIVETEGGAVGKAIAPSGASKSSKEAIELRDGGRAWGGKGVMRAIAAINETIAPRLKGLDVRGQPFIDETLIALDGTPNKSRLGANAVVAVSMAVAKAAAAQAGLPLYRYLGGVGANVLPLPLMNIINGGVHAGNELSFQEFLIATHGAESFVEAMKIAVEIYGSLRSLLKERYGKGSINVGDEGGFAPPMRRSEEALDAIMTAIKQAGHEGRVALGIDAAADQFYSGGSYLVDGKSLSAGELLDLYVDLASRYPIVYIEDPFQEDDLASFAQLTAKIGNRVLVVGDDLYATNVEHLRKGIEARATNAALLKVNQIGTVSEAIEFHRLASSSGMRVIVSHRSGDTEDDFIADLAVALGGLIKTGAPARGERTAKYNRLLEIEQELWPACSYAGRDALR